MSEIRYSLELKYSDEDGCYLGRCPEIAPFVNMGGAVAHGDTWEEAARETEVAVRNVLSYLIKNGTDIPLPLKYEATIPRATVAAALRELRHRLDVALDEPLQWPAPTKHNRCRAIAEVDATIAKLGLEDEAQEETK